MKNEFFETIKVDDAKIYNIEYHQTRYEKTLKSLGQDAYFDLASYIKAPTNKLLRCKIIYDAKGIQSVEYFSYLKRKINSLKLIYNDNIEYNLKFTNRNTINSLYEQKEKCDDILIVKNGYITDTSIANIALYKDGIWYTPKQTLLDGTTRNRYIKTEKIIQKDIKVEELYSFSKVALLNAMIDFDIMSLNKGDFFVK